MAQVFHLYRHPNGPRVWFLGQRVHHGAVGVLLAIACTAANLHHGLVVAVLLAAHDAHDWRIWFRRERLPAEALQFERAPAPRAS